MMNGECYIARVEILNFIIHHSVTAVLIVLSIKCSGLP